MPKRERESESERMREREREKTKLPKKKEQSIGTKEMNFGRTKSILAFSTEAHLFNAFFHFDIKLPFNPLSFKPLKLLHKFVLSFNFPHFISTCRTQVL